MKRLLMFLLLFAWGCESKPQTEAPDGTVFFRSFIQAYVIPNTLLAYDPGIEGYIGIQFEGRRVGESNRDQEEKAEYDKLCQRYSDMSYNRNAVPNSFKALGVEYRAVDVTCNKTFDTKHPAGTSLKDVVKICASSIKYFIDNKYEGSHQTQPSQPEWDCLSFGFTPIFKLLSEMTREDLVLVEPILYLYFPEHPAAGEYEFTVKISSDEGSLTSTVPIKFS